MPMWSELLPSAMGRQVRIGLTWLLPARHHGSLETPGFVAMGLVALVDSLPSLVLPQSFSPTRLIQGSRHDVDLRGAERESR